MFNVDVSLYIYSLRHDTIHPLAFPIRPPWTLPRRNSIHPAMRRVAGDTSCTGTADCATSVSHCSLSPRNTAHKSPPSIWNVSRPGTEAGRVCECACGQWVCSVPNDGWVFGMVKRWVLSIVCRSWQERSVRSWEITIRVGVEVWGGINNYYSWVSTRLGHIAVRCELLSQEEAPAKKTELF